MDRRKFIRRSAISAGVVLTGGVVLANEQRPTGQNSQINGCRKFSDRDADEYCDHSNTCRKNCSKKKPVESTEGKKE